MQPMMPEFSIAKVVFETQPFSFWLFIDKREYNYQLKYNFSPWYQHSVIFPLAITLLVTQNNVIH